jgi:predicted DNA-binding protein with PD1-like motif
MVQNNRKKIKAVIPFSLKKGDDLLNGILEICQKNKVKSAVILAIGALQKVKFSYYDQKKKCYLDKAIGEPVEIVSCFGNLSKKEKNLFLHLHIAVAKRNGTVFGGHLKEGSIVFALEGLIFELEGESIEREYDKETGLFLLKI